MKKILFLAILSISCACAAFASGSTEEDRFTEQTYNAAVGRTLGHTLDQNESVVASTTWLWYEKKWDSDWDLQRFDFAVETGAKNCRNEAMLAAARAGKFGEKVLKALVVSASDAAEAFSDWVEKNSSRYDENNKSK